MVIAITVTGIARACTTFLINHNGQIVFGRNYDWITGNGMVCTNQKGLVKISYKQIDGNAINWVSKYGSVSFNQYGKEFPTGGMNEKGLVIELMWMDGTQYPLYDSRPVVSELQWIQYQLDNCSTIAEVIKTDTLLRISSSSTPLHFLIADSTGNAATLEYINGKLVAHYDKDLPFPVLTNNFYSSSAKYVLNNNNLSNPYSFQGNSIERFATACTMINNFQTKNINQPIIDYSFKILETVKQANFTKWSIVYDITNRKIYFKSADHQKIKWLRFSDFDFSSTINSLLFYINQNFKGDIVKYFIPFTADISKKVLEITIEESKSKIIFSPEAITKRLQYIKLINLLD